MRREESRLRSGQPQLDYRQKPPVHRAPLRATGGFCRCGVRLRDDHPVSLPASARLRQRAPPSWLRGLSAGEIIVHSPDGPDLTIAPEMRQGQVVFTVPRLEVYDLVEVKLGAGEKPEG